MSAMLALLFHDVYQSDPASSGFAGVAAARYKLSLAEFERQLDGLARNLRRAPGLLHGASVATPDSALAPTVTLTFDDGGASYLGLVADRLEHRGWRAHCLVTTDRIGSRGFLDAAGLRELHARGHAIGSHSASHPARFAALDDARLHAEWRDSRTALEDLLGAPVSTGSVPGGDYAPRVARAAAACGLALLFTSEPVQRPERVAGCLVVGRYAVRHGARPDLCARLARDDPATLAAEWLVWNAKKPLKACLRAGYPRVAGWMARAGSG